MTLQRPQSDINPLDIAYADDVDFVSYSHTYLDQMEKIIPTCLTTTLSSLMSTKVRQRGPPWDERLTVWQKCGGPLLEDAEDMGCRWTLWLGWLQNIEALCLQLYNTFIVPVLTYNMGVYALTQTESACSNSFYRTQLNQLLGIRWPQNIPNKALCKRCQCELINSKIIEAWWKIIWTCTEDVQKLTSTDGNWSILPTNYWCTKLEKTTMDHTTSDAQCQPTEHWTPSTQQGWLENLRQLATNRLEWSQRTKRHKQNWFSYSACTYLRLVTVCNVEMLHIRTS